MAAITPATARLKIVHDAKGRMRAYYDGSPLVGVLSIECEQESSPHLAAEVTLRFHGRAVRFVTEAASSEDIVNGDDEIGR